MNQPTKVFVAMLVIAALLVVAFFTIGPAAEIVYLSPQEVVEGAKKASRKGDMRAWCQCLTEGSRDRLAAESVVTMLAIQQAFAKGSKERAAQARELQQIAERHGLKEDFLAKMHENARVLVDDQASVEEKLEFSRALLAPVRNRNAFAADMYKEIQKITGKEGPMDLWKDASLSDVRITGETAKGTMSFDGGGTTTLTFRRQGESWRIDLIAMEKRPPAPPMMPR